MSKLNDDHIMIEVPSEAHLDEKDTVFIVDLTNLADLIKAQPHIIPGPALHQLSITALLDNKMAIIQLHVLNVILSQLFHFKNSILLLCLINPYLTPVRLWLQLSDRWGRGSKNWLNIKKPKSKNISMELLPSLGFKPSPGSNRFCLTLMEAYYAYDRIDQDELIASYKFYSYHITNLIWYIFQKALLHDQLIHIKSIY